MEAVLEKNQSILESSHNSSMSDNMLNISTRARGVGKMLKEGNVVKSLTIGNTKIKICDDYCRDRTPDEVQAILDRIAYMAQMQLSAYSSTQNNK